MKHLGVFNSRWRSLFTIAGVVVVALQTLQQAARAEGNAIQYTFTSVNNGAYPNTVIESFQFTAPNFISSDGYVDAPSLNYCSITGFAVTNGVYTPLPCAWVAFLPSHPGSGMIPAAEIDVAFYYWMQGGFGGGGGANYFPPGSFSAIGEYDVLFSNDHYTAHLSVKKVPAPEPVDLLTQNPQQTFRSFVAKTTKQADGFQLNSVFVVRNPATVVNPVSSPVALRVGSFFARIPPGSFQQNGDEYVYEGTVNGVTLRAIITSRGNGQYSLQVEGQGVNLDGSPQPLYIALLIADFACGAVTPPVVTVSAIPSTLSPPNGEMVPVTVYGTVTGSGWGLNPATVTYSVADENGTVKSSGPVTLGPSGTYSVFRISLQASLGAQYTITVSAEDLWGNQGSASTVVTVLHD